MTQYLIFPKVLATSQEFTICVRRKGELIGSNAPVFDMATETEVWVSLNRSPSPVSIDEIEWRAVGRSPVTMEEVPVSDVIVEPPYLKVHTVWSPKTAAAATPVLHMTAHELTMYVAGVLREEYQLMVHCGIAEGEFPSFVKLTFYVAHPTPDDYHFVHDMAESIVPSDERRVGLAFRFALNCAVDKAAMVHRAKELVCEALDMIT